MIIDSDDVVCMDGLIIFMLEFCFDQCVILLMIIILLYCDDNGILSDLLDDLYYFEVMVVGQNMGGDGWFVVDGQ